MVVDCVWHGRKYAISEDRLRILVWLTGRWHIPSYSGSTGTILGALILSVLTLMLMFLNVGRAIRQMVYGVALLPLAWGYSSLTGPGVIIVKVALVIRFGQSVQYSRIATRENQPT